MARRRILPRRTKADEEGEDPTAPGDLTPDDDAESSDGVGDDLDAAAAELDDFDDAVLEEEISHLYADDSEALARWKDRLSTYVDLQGTLDALRLRPSSEQPWPSFDNPMLGYLKERGSEIADNDGLEAAVAWLAANAWFEGAIAERSRFIRLLDAD